MSVSIGFLGKFAIKEQSDFETGIAFNNWVTSAYLLPVLSESFSPEIARVPSPILDGTAGQRADRRGNKSISGGLELELDYLNINTILKACFGSVNAGVYTFVDTEHTPVGFLIQKTISRFRVIGAKCDNFSLSGSQGDNWKLASSWKAFDNDRSSSDAFPSLTLNSHDPWRFDSTKIRLSRISDGNLADGSHQIYVTDVNIDVNHQLQEPIYVTRSANANKTIEMLKSGFREVKISLTFPRYEDTANITNISELIDWEAADSALQMDIVIAGSANTATIRFPHIKLSNIPNVNISGPEPGTVSIELMAYVNNSVNTNTNMTFTEEMRLIIT
jgi:hypothetical protein